MCTSSVSDMMYHKFSHGAAFYTLNGKSVNVILEFSILYVHANCRSRYTSVSSDSVDSGANFGLPLKY